MLEYETANPGQDKSKPENEHFNPDLDHSNPRVSFAPEEYAMEEGRVTSNGDSHGNFGTPREYGVGRRPFSSSPAPPHPNDQFAGLVDGGMHANELIEERQTSQNGTTSSDQTLYLASEYPAGTNAVKTAMKPCSRGHIGAGNERSVRSNTYNNRNMGSGIPTDEDFYDKA